MSFTDIFTTIVILCWALRPLLGLAQEYDALKARERVTP